MTGRQPEWSVFVLNEDGNHNLPTPDKCGRFSSPDRDFVLRHARILRTHLDGLRDRDTGPIEKNPRWAVWVMDPDWRAIETLRDERPRY